MVAVEISSSSPQWGLWWLFATNVVVAYSYFKALIAIMGNFCMFVHIVKEVIQLIDN